MFDPEKFGQAMGEAIRKAVEPLQAEIAALKNQLTQKPDFTQAIADEVKSQVSQLPSPEPAKSLTAADIEPMVRAEVEKAVAAIPPAKDGAGAAGAMIDRDGNLILTMTNGEVKNLGPVVGKNGADLSEVTFEYDGERTLTIKGKGGEITKRLPIPMDKGYYRDGMGPCEKGDIVTHDGTAWIALKDTNTRPGPDAKEDWRLFARKGRDGETVVRKVPTGPAEPIKLKD